MKYSITFSSSTSVLLLAFTFQAGTTEFGIAAQDSIPMTVPDRDGTFTVYLEGFTDNPQVADIAYVTMLVHVDINDPWILNSTGIGSDNSSWWEGWESGSMQGFDSFYLSAHDPHAIQWGGYVEYPLQDGILLYANCTAPVVELTDIDFWVIGQVGDHGNGLYPDLVVMTEFSSTQVMFSVRSVASESVTWGGVKRLYRP